MQNISVIIPTYNRAHSIGDAIKSVLAQSYGFYELIVVDDGSDDQTEAVVWSFHDDRIRFHRMPQNRGAAAARNEGVRLSKADIIAFLDSDDIWLPRKIETQISYWEAHRDYSMIYSRFHYRQDSEGGYAPFSDLAGRKMEGDIYLELLEKNVIGTPTILVDKACFCAIGGFDESLRSLEDWDLVVRFAKDYLIGFVNESLTECFMENATSVSSNMEEHMRVRLKMLKEHRDVLEQNGMFETLLVRLFSVAQQTGLGSFVKKSFQDIFFGL